MRAYTGVDNYAPLAAKLQKPPAAWDKDGDGAWSGYVPDCAFSFDERGFDRDRCRGPHRLAGLRLLSLPSSWPTNGWTGDVLIRRLSWLHGPVMVPTMLMVILWAVS